MQKHFACLVPGNLNTLICSWPDSQVMLAVEEKRFAE